MANQSSWRSSVPTETYSAHDFADFAQEFLRRNSDYQREWVETEQRIGVTCEIADQLREGLAGRWGLCFPLCARRNAATRSGFVAARTATWRRGPGRPGTTIGVYPAIGR